MRRKGKEENKLGRLGSLNFLIVFGSYGVIITHSFVALGRETRTLALLIKPKYIDDNYPGQSLQVILLNL